MARVEAGDREYLIYLLIFKQISLFAANSIFSLQKQFSQVMNKSKNLERYARINSFLEPATLLK